MLKHCPATSTRSRTAQPFAWRCGVWRTGRLERLRRRRQGRGCYHGRHVGVSAQSAALLQCAALWRCALAGPPSASHGNVAQACPRPPPAAPLPCATLGRCCAAWVPQRYTSAGLHVAALLCCYSCSMLLREAAAHASNSALLLACNPHVKANLSCQQPPPARCL